ncbi:Gfo/Idh/MocA family protein [Nocardiopsis tropica]|uniref:Gfo/Idh/MocA family oxidoreductase n=1 Tax=Nocardiopsis tropica TaxID=109330 RepID=A0ABV1ZRM4_9ACTN
MSRPSTGIAVVGCGYVSDFYLNPLIDHPELTLVGVHDRITERAAAVGERHGVEVYRTLSELLSDDRVQIVVNLTNPESHADVTLAALAAGRHVYTEKPLATDVADGRRIVEEADRSGLLVACAPANVLGEAFQTVWREVREGSVRTPRLVYAQLDDGAVHLMDFPTWHNSTGSPWPYKDEFALGCNIEHSAYHLSALTTLFGPVDRVVADHATLMPDKLPPGEEGGVGPDYVTASLRFGSGVVARLTCSIVAPPDRSLTVVGDGGVLRLDNCWDFGSPITLRTATDPGHDYLLPENEVEHVRPFVYRKHYSADHRMSFPRGIADLASAVEEGRTPRLSARQALHVLEVTLAMTSPTNVTAISSRFDAPEPLPWAL